MAAGACFDFQAAIQSRALTELVACEQQSRVQGETLWQNRAEQMHKPAPLHKSHDYWAAFTATGALGPTFQHTPMLPNVRSVHDHRGKAASALISAVRAVYTFTRTQRLRDTPRLAPLFVEKPVTDVLSKAMMS